MMDEASRTWRVRLEVRHLFPEPGMPEIIHKLQERLGEDLLDVRHRSGALSVRLLVNAPSKQAAITTAATTLTPELNKVVLGTFSIARASATPERRLRAHA